MAKYRVALVATIPGNAQIEVEATSKAEAEAKAYEIVQRAVPGQIRWDCDLDYVDDELVEVLEVEERF